MKKQKELIGELKQLSTSVLNEKAQKALKGGNEIVIDDMVDL